jgi:hypothetical protein
MTSVASTQDHLDIEDIREGVVLLKNNGAAAVISTTAVNFDLLSELEQDSMIAAYSQFLNSLTFSIQVVIHSKKMDISSYVESLAAVENSQTNPYLKEQIRSYRTYVSELISKNEVLDKKFYIIIPYQEVAFNTQVSIFDAFLGFLGMPPKKQPRVNRRALLEKARIQLEPKIDQIIKQLARVGLKARRLGTQELVELFYDIYNPNASREERLRGSASEYTAPIVQASIESGK